MAQTQIIKRGQIDPVTGKIVWTEITEISVAKPRMPSADEIAEDIVNGVYSLRHGSSRGVPGLAKEKPLPADVSRNYLQMQGEQIGNFRAAAFLYPAGSEHAGHGTVALMKQDTKGQWRPIAWSSAVFGQDHARVIMGQIDDSIKSTFNQPNGGRHKIAAELAEGYDERRAAAGFAKYSKKFEEVKPTEVAGTLPRPSFSDWEADKYSAITMRSGIGGRKRTTTNPLPREHASRAERKEYGLGSVTPRKTIDWINEETGEITRFQGTETDEEMMARRRDEKIRRIKEMTAAKIINERTAVEARGKARYVSLEAGESRPFDVALAVDFWIDRMKEDGITKTGEDMHRWIERSRTDKHGRFQDTPMSNLRKEVRKQVNARASKLNLPDITPAQRPLPPKVKLQVQRLVADEKEQATPRWWLERKRFAELSDEAKIAFWETQLKSDIALLGRRMAMTAGNAVRTLYAWGDLSEENRVLVDKIIGPVLASKPVFTSYVPPELTWEQRKALRDEGIDIANTPPKELPNPEPILYKLVEQGDK